MVKRSASPFSGVKQGASLQPTHNINNNTQKSQQEKNIFSSIVPTSPYSLSSFFLVALSEATTRGNLFHLARLSGAK
jgi:hypothetical protein